MTRVMMRHRPLLVELAENPWLYVGVALAVLIGLWLASERFQGWWWRYRILRDLARRPGRGPKWPLP